MSLDPFTGGLSPEQDYALTAALPEDPEAVETFNVWFHDGLRQIGINLHPHARAGKMDGAATVFLSDGRILRGNGKPGVFTRPEAPESKYLKFHCDRPFHRWTYRVVDMPMFVTSVEEQKRGLVSENREPTVTVSVEIRASARAHPWLWGTLLPESREAVKGPAGLWIGCRLSSGIAPGISFRYDQAMSAEGTIVVDGEEFPFRGDGLRAHVRGVRRLEGFKGHTWMGGVFPSGKTFGVNAMFRSDGGFHCNEAYVFQDGTLYPHRVLHCTPQQHDAADRRFVVELACDELGLTRIIGEDRATLWWLMERWGAPRLGYGFDPAAPLLMSQALACFKCQGEVGYGHDERSG